MLRAGHVGYRQILLQKSFSHGVTHHIAPNIDNESDLLMRDPRGDWIKENFQISGTGPTLLVRNGEGDPYCTDGEIDIATPVIDGVRQAESPATLPPPMLVALKHQIWHRISNTINLQASLVDIFGLVPI